jgi:CTP-dependent riboflavin kinase
MATAAAIVARARRDVISHFMERNAVSSDAAVRWVPERHIQRRMLARLMRRGVLVETGEDTYFLDVPAYDRWRRSLRLRTVVLLAGVAVVGAAFAALA